MGQAKRFPNGLHYAIRYDTTPFIRESVDEVIHTLLESVVLVGAVILLFLQDWRALLLPIIDMAVSLVGTFAVMKLMGFYASPGTAGARSLPSWTRASASTGGWMWRPARRAVT